MFVDGYHAKTKTVYEFQGCEFHGCKTCKPNERHVKTFHHPDRTVDEMYEVTKMKTKLIREASYKVVETWECVFKKEMETNEEMQQVVKSMTWTEPLNPRGAFIGGRTGLNACYYKAKEVEKIFYKDVTTLYLWVNNYCTYPVGHPAIFVNPVNQEIDDDIGLAKVDV